ncbi:MAG TPA: RNA polymerase sigma factor [Actinomycetota bacterium]
METVPGNDELLADSVERPELFTDFYDRHARDVLGYFARRTLDAEVAAELAAETFAQAFESRARFVVGRGPAEAWLATIARRQLSHYWRRLRVADRARRHLGIPRIALEDEDLERIEALIDFEAIGRAVAAAFSRLSDDQREALRLRVIEGRSYAEAAAALSCSEQVVRARVSRGLRRLAAHLETGGSTHA